MATPTPDEVAITSLLKRERFYRDTAQWDQCRAAFHPDATTTYIHVAWYEGHVDDFLRQSAQMNHTGKVNIIHSAFDPVDIRVRGDRAISEGFCLVTSSLTLGGGGGSGGSGSAGSSSVDYELASYMRLFSRLQKVKVKADEKETKFSEFSSSFSSDSTGEWRLLSLESSYVRDRLVTAFPFPSANAPSPLVMNKEVQAYPKCYRHLALVMLHRGLKPRADLPHEDAPESIRRILSHNHAFLENGTVETRMGLVKSGKVG